MNRIYILMTLIILSFSQIILAQRPQQRPQQRLRQRTRERAHAKTDANIVGHVVSNGKHIPFSTVAIKGSTIGITTDESGHYQLINLPVGRHIVVAQSLGYKPKELEITIEKNQTKELNFDLEQDVLNLEELVVTGNRSASNKLESSTIVTTLSSKLFASTQSVTLSDGLNFAPGLRMENNCQNCGFSQVRMNGMEGPYSQILINSRPIFSGLAGVYGLELIPASMIERVEVIRGGGSALYGSNAIAGTINLIIKDPINNSYEFGTNSAIIGAGMDGAGDVAQDNSINFSGSLVSADNKTGMSLYGFHRDREPFDANDDSFSEIASLNNTTIGARLFHRFGTRNKMTADFFNIKEERRGGDKFDYPKHEANITEAVDHNITTGALTYEQFFRGSDLFSVFASGQKVNRDSYYGAEKSLKDYGNTKDFSYTLGAQYNANFETSNLIVGVENNAGWLKDKKMGYADYENATIEDGVITDVPHTNNVTVANQSTNTTGVFGQYEINWNNFLLSAGARFDHYKVEDKESTNPDASGNVLSPRLSLKYNLKNFLQARVSYSQGYRAPQIFDEDLHVETSGSRKIIHKNSPSLKQERSHSYMASLNYNKRINNVHFDFLVEGFYTQLNDPFSNEFSDPDENGTVVYTRVNAKKGANVKGVNMELNVVPSDKFSLSAGFTIQSSEYEEEQEFDEKRFFRTPDNYGFMTLDWQTTNKLGFSFTSNYTGQMLVPYFGMQLPNPDEGELRETETFMDLGIKGRYNIKLNGATLQLFAGVKNLLNSYQVNFDSGINRDPGYVYGPMNPRTIYVGIKIGNFLK